MQHTRVPGAEQLRSLIDAFPERVAVLDDAGQLVLANATWRRSAPPDVGESAANALRALLAGEILEFEQPYSVREADEPRRFELIGRRLGDGLVLLRHVDITRRWVAEERVRIESAVSGSIQGKQDVGEAAAALIRSICEAAGWTAGAFWELDPQMGVLRCTSFHWPESPASALESASWDHFSEIGEGWIGGIWSSTSPRCLPDAPKAPGTFERAEAASRSEIKAAFGFPLTIGSETVGVIELFSHEERRPEAQLLEVATAAGAQVGQLVHRKRAESHLRQMFDGAPDGLLLLDENGTVLAANQRIESMFGYDRDDIVAASVQKLLPGIGLERIETCTSGQNASGREFPVEVGSNLIRLASSNEWVLSIRDVSARRMLENQLLSSRRLEAVGQLAAGVAHEINTPMQFIGDNTTFVGEALTDLSEMLRDYREAVDEARAGELSQERFEKLQEAYEARELEYLLEAMPKAIQSVSEGVSRVAEIVRAMKQFSHPGGEAQAPVTLSEALRTTITVSRNEWKYVADVVEDFDPELPAVPGFAGPLNQVFLNLIVNAAHAIADVVGDASAGKGKITICTRLEDDHAVVRIGDTGTGVPEQARDKLFDPFFTTKEVGRGTGQGLALAHAIVVQKHRGTLAFETEMGVGTTFVIRLPLQAA